MDVNGTDILIRRGAFQDEILARKEAALTFPVSVQGVTKHLIPDALFGLEYTQAGKRYYRFFLVEADRWRDNQVLVYAGAIIVLFLFSFLRRWTRRENFSYSSML